MHYFSLDLICVPCWANLGAGGSLGDVVVAEIRSPEKSEGQSSVNQAGLDRLKAFLKGSQSGWTGSLGYSGIRD